MAQSTVPSLENQQEREVAASKKTGYETLYAQGYGHFCFGRWSDRRDPQLPDRLIISDEILQATSHATEVLEPDGFRRVNQFPFYKLPGELQQRVLHLLLHPIYNNHSNEKTGFTTMWLDKKCYTEDVYYNFHRFDTFEDYLNLFQLINRKPPPMGKTLEFWSASAKFSSQKADIAHHTRPFPSEAKHQDFEFRFHLDRLGAETFVWSQRQDWSFFDWIRRAFNTSRQFRFDLGRVLWSRVNLSFTPEGYNMVDTLINCLMERPGVLPGIKRLELNPALDTVSNQEDVRVCLEDFGQTLTALSQLDGLRLEELRIVITTDEDFFEEASFAKGPWANLRRCREIFVSKVFEVEIRDEWLAYQDRDYRSRCARGSERREVYKYDSRFRDLMLPDSLRPKTPITEAEIYLAGRIEPLMKTEKA